MTEVEVSPEAPAWMLALEKKRQRVHRLAHEVGAGSPCLKCQEDCPGLDLHFWRKICRNCKCKKEDHDVIDDCGFEQFDILLGSGNSTNRPNKAFLEMLEKHTIAGLKNKTKNVAFDWVPPDVSPAVAAEYMQSLPASKLPISGSDGALYRRQQLERQLPLHDLDANQCHQLTDTEVDNLRKYLENLKSNVVGQGRVTKLTVPSSNSLDSLQKIRVFNSVPKPFQSNTSGPLSDSSSNFNIGGDVKAGQSVHLKPPSAFWPKSISPEPPRSVSPAADGALGSVADCGSAFGVTLSPASQRRSPGSKSSVHIASQDSGLPASSQNMSINQQRARSQLLKDQFPKLIAQSKNVPGNMWVPSECEECSRRVVDGHLVKDQVCAHIATSRDIPHSELQSECLECVRKGIDHQLVSSGVCVHVAESGSVPSVMQSTPCVECSKEGLDGQLVRGQVCMHIAESQDIHHPMSAAELSRHSGKDFAGQSVDQFQSNDAVGGNTQYPLPVTCSECISQYVDGRLVVGNMCPHIGQTYGMPVEMVLGHAYPMGVNVNHSQWGSRSYVPARELASIGEEPSALKSHGHNLPNSSSGEILNKRGLSPGPPPNQNEYSPSALGMAREREDRQPDSAAYPGGNSLPVLHPSSDEKIDSLLGDKPQKNVMSSPGAPHMMALYAHNALNSPSNLDPQDSLSPHVASILIDDGVPSGFSIDDEVTNFVDPVHSDSVKLELHCVQCREVISPGEVVVFADRAGTDVVWHPKCFVCNTCQELLVDLVYFFNSGRVYCGRHYAEILDIPRCSACDELIFVKEYTVAEGQAFHVKHFCCFECDEPLGGKQYVPKDGQPICLPCYEHKYGKQCETCQLMIGAQDQRVTWKDFHWHAAAECFRCNFCQKSLLGGRFAVKDQRPFCSKECMQAGVSSTHQKVSAV